MGEGFGAMRDPHMFQTWDWPCCVAASLTSTNADWGHAAHQVSESMRTQAREMAENNLAQEQVMGELRNQIAIIR